MGLFSFIFGKKKQPQSDTGNAPDAFYDTGTNIIKVSIPTMPMPQKDDFSYLLEDIRKAFSKLYVKLTENYERFGGDSELPDGVYYGKTKYTGETNKTGKREVAFVLADATIAGKLTRQQWNTYEKNIGKDNLNWIGYVQNGNLSVFVAEKFKEEFITHLLTYDYPNWIAQTRLAQMVKAEIEKQNLPTGEYINKKAQREGYDGLYDLHYNGKYMIAGCFMYVDGSFVAVGYAENESDNIKNPKAMVVKTLDGTKVGYVAERELAQFYNETGGTRTPLIVEAHYWQGKLYGNMFTYTDNVEEYWHMEAQYKRLLEEHYNK